MSDKKTALFSCHEALNASMVAFAGTLLPVRYKSEKDEHLAVRQHAGLFDVSHMGEIFVSGPGAFEFLQAILSNNLEKINDGGAQYSLLLNQLGGIIDDLIVYRFDQNKYLLCVNAANIEKDWAWISEQKSNFAVVLENASSKYAQIALQGPRSFDILKTITKSPLPKSFCFTSCEMFGFEVLVASTGYTGEKGVEIFVDNEHAVALWQGLLKKGRKFGITPCGLAARDSLRLEAGLPLHGQDISEDTTPLDAGLMFAVDLEKLTFIGQEALRQQKLLGIERKLMGFRLLERGICRHGFAVFDSEKKLIGEVTSGTWPPNHETAIGMAYLDCSVDRLGSEIFIDVRGSLKKAVVVKPRFIKK